MHDDSSVDGVVLMDAIEDAVRSHGRLLDSIGEAIIATDLEGRVAYWNQAAESLYGWSSEEVAGRPLLEFLMPEGMEERAAEIMSEVVSRGLWSGEFDVRHKDGALMPILVTDTPITDGRGVAVGIIGISMDITDRKRAEDALKESEARLEVAQSIARVGDWTWEISTDTAIWSKEMHRMLGIPEGSPAGYETFFNRLHPEDRPHTESVIREALMNTSPFDYYARILHPDGEIRWIYSRGAVLADAGGSPLKMHGIVQDVTERKSLEEKLHYQAFHDDLTGLPNRNLFMDRVEQALLRSKRRENEVALLFIDLDNFKIINDSLGHQMGDRVLAQVAERLRYSLRSEDTLARFGGDEFIILLEGAKSFTDAPEVAERIMCTLKEPLSVGGEKLFVSASVGIARGGASKDSSELIRDADTAMYHAKRRVGGGYLPFDPAMRRRSLERLNLENDLRRAIREEELVVHYQPIVRLHTGEVWGVEALARWRHPKRGLLSPADFIPVAEESGLIVEFGERILREACRQAVVWREKRPRLTPLVMSVNVSAKQIGRGGVESVVANILRECGLEPHLLNLDVTESAYINALDGNALVLDNLKRSGVGLSIDDFGVGYSSLSYLKRIPAEMVKIDGSFAVGLGTDAENTAIVQMIIDLAHTLGMEVAAEGVEDGFQAAQLRDMGCDFMQGHHFSRAMPPVEIERVIFG